MKPLFRATVVPNFEEEKRFIVFVTKNGMIKKTELNQYKYSVTQERSLL
ncbi:hypothetical protein ACT7DH_06355 [Bacillus pacificus]